MGKKIDRWLLLDHTGSCSCGCIFMESTDRMALGDRAGRSVRLYRTGGGRLFRGRDGSTGDGRDGALCESGGF